MNNNKLNIDAHNFIQRANNLIMKANTSSCIWFLTDEIKPNELLIYKTKSIQSNPLIKYYIKKLKFHNIEVIFEKCCDIVNKVIIYENNNKKLRVIECVY